VGVSLEGVGKGERKMSLSTFLGLSASVTGKKVLSLVTGGLLRGSVSIRRKQDSGVSYIVNGKSSNSG